LFHYALLFSSSNSERHNLIKGPETMKYFILASFLSLIILFIVQGSVSAQDNSVISDSLYSNILKEQRSIKILLPESYKPGSTEKYEVIYLTDGEWVVNLFPFIYKFAKDENYVPPAIIVAVPNTYLKKANQRDRDFLPVQVAEPAISGGAGNFLSFFKNELIPYIDKTYPANGTRSLYGHSYGGLFVLYALLSEPDVFNSYYATDPPFRWNHDYLINMASEKVSTLPPNKLLWLAGIESTYKYQGIDLLDSVLHRKAPQSLHWNMATYPNEKHNSVRLKAMYDGIKYSYSGYSNTPLMFHPMNGIVLKDKAVSIWVLESYPELRFTTDGTEPGTQSQKADSKFSITGPAQLVLKSFSASGKYDKTARGNFVLGEALPSIPKPNKVKQGGLQYSYYEGNWEKIPDFKNLTPVKTGVVDSTFTASTFPKKSNYACLMEGYFEILMDGYYDFVLISQEGSKLFLGNKLIIDNDGVHSMQSVKTFILPLKKGFYPVRVEYFQKNDNSVFQLLYLNEMAQNPSNVPFRLQYYNE
jgi:predicted alpha/beta superfamily hydrolase